jgi:hypothetical protein
MRPDMKGDYRQNSICHFDIQFDPIIQFYSAKSYSAVSYSAVSYSAVSYSAVSYSAVSYSAVLYSAVLYSTVLYSAVSYSAVLYSAKSYSVVLWQFYMTYRILDLKLYKIAGSYIHKKHGGRLHS